MRTPARGGSGLKSTRASPDLLVVRSSLSFVIALVALPGSAFAQEAGDRHRVELAVDGGLSWISADPTQLDPAIGGQVGGRAMLDLVHVRFDARAWLPDPARPELFSVGGDARLLFIVAHDLTWRRDDRGELLRLFGGLGGEIDIEDVAHLMLSAGFAMIRVGPIDEADNPFSEAYGAYAGATLRLHFWELRDELRVAFHGMMQPPGSVLELAAGPDAIFDALVPGFTVSNRLYLQVLREGPVAFGPELRVNFEELLEGPLLYATLGVSGTLGF